MTSEKWVTLENRGAHAFITLNRPDKHNALHAAAQLQLQHALQQCVGRHAAVILTGAGDSFCAGIETETGATGAVHSRQGHTWIETVEMIRKHPAVVIAAVNGDAAGDGVTLINACDIAIAADHAGIALPDITHGNYPAIAGPTTQLRILRKHASWMILTGKRIDARTAARWGLVNSVTSKERLMDEAVAIAEEIARLNPITVDWTKKAIDDIPAHVSDWTAALEYGRMVTAVIQNQIGKENFMPKKF